MDQNTKTWDLTKLHELFTKDEIPKILGIHPTKAFSRDSFSWSYTKSGLYSVRSGYWAAKALSQSDCDLLFQGPSVQTL